VQSQRAPVGTVSNNLPRQVMDELVGRSEEIAALHTIFAAGTGGITLIDGAAGTGKTTLALYFCHELASQEAPPADVIIWLSARTSLLQTEGEVPTVASASDLGDLTATIAIALDRRDLLRLPVDQRAAGITAALADIRSTIVLDNFETVTDPQVLPYLNDLPQSASVIITSRRRIDTRHRIHLQPLDAESTKSLVRAGLRQRRLDQTVQTIDWIVDMCGGIPLAINWLIGRIALGAPHLAAGTGRLDDEALLRYLFEVGVRQAADVSSVLPLLVLAHPPANIPDSLLESALAELGLSESEIAGSLATLATLNLIEYNPAWRRYYILPVIKRFLLERFSGEDIVVPISRESIRHAYIRALTEHLNDESDSLWNIGYTLNRWDRDRTNALSSIRTTLAHKEIELAAGLLLAFYPFAITFGHFDEFIEFSEAVLAESDELGLMEVVELRARRASILFHSGDVDAADEEFALADALFAPVAATASDRIIDLMFFIRAIIAVWRLAPDAEQILQEAIEFSRRRGVVWTRLGFQGWLATYLIGVGRLTEADELLTSSFAECEESGDQRTSVFLHVALAKLRLATGDYDSILRTAPAVLANASEYGEDHNWAHLHLAVARAFWHKGQLDDSRQHVEVARDLYVRLGAQTGIEDCDDLISLLD
ncbi:ATP-binding protein, partial [Actinomadura sp. KC216]|uniref:ATP-binding protein n=1 Tax=Actinomadura sp. KC216 TaxID=2530370 RepID=UPI001046E72B